MKFYVNNTPWTIRYVHPSSEYLRRMNGTYTLGVTDNSLKIVFISSHLSDEMKYRVLCHEMVHVYSFEYGCDIDEETEELIADFISLYGRDLLDITDYILNCAMLSASRA